MQEFRLKNVSDKNPNSRPFKICSIVGMDDARVIGFQNKLPWHIPEDMKRFAALTTGHTVLMGRKTYDSLPDRFRPLPKRKNVVLSRNPSSATVADGVEVFTSPEEAIVFFENRPSALQGEILWVLGGGEIYRQTMAVVDEVFLTRVKGVHEGDTYFPPFEDEFNLADSEEHERFAFQRYVRKPL